MTTKLEELKKKELIKIIKSLWIEKKLKAIENKYSHNQAKIEQLELLAIECGTEIDNLILSYFGYDV
jgi:hypothetical protein